MRNISNIQHEVSKCLAYRNILKSIVKKLEEKNQKFSFFGTRINFNQVCSSHAICRAAHERAIIAINAESEKSENFFLNLIFSIPMLNTVLTIS